MNYFETLKETYFYLYILSKINWNIFIGVTYLKLKNTFNFEKRTYTVYLTLYLNNKKLNFKNLIKPS